ncbi:fungal hydrophobin [Fomitiporia mediterranea MF3/22]|uniref:fungal hydrophobin n=1 Tax=Fomitiporia mediterranea (strain MF3/22) TaxID=694068 RepID=UPI0004407C12|nr:fungal hydrophobin [Fomitiporia mediterranea MF3/22]EJD01684.1 fungal hydrophobin [Fomitiporia mediterranea MF3/22]
MPGGEPTTKPATTSTVTVTAPASTSTQPASQCNTGDLQCCNSVQSSDSSGLAGLLSLLGVVLQGVAVPVGLTCDPISVIGLGSNSCSAQPVCCSNNNFNGVIALGCTPVNLNL